MKPERWQQVEALFQQALEQPLESRSSFINEACKEDLVLRQELEGLLGALSEAKSFLETPAADSFGPNLSPGLTTGQKLAHYEIISQLGVGGMGEVYLAHDTKLDRQIALKLLPAQFAADPDRVRRFEREARAASALNHPNILVIHEIGHDEGKHFIATEYIAGETLRQRSDHGKLDQHEAVGIARQVASALDAAHHAGLIHRDIKPENIMIWPDGLVKVLDFGLAKPIGEESELPRADAGDRNLTLETDPELLIGSLNYLSPEQVRHEKLDARTDIFSLGVVLYEMLSGTRPFSRATSAEVCAAILADEPTPLATSLTNIINKAMAKDRGQRYQTAAELRSDLEAQLKTPESAKWRRATLALVLLTSTVMVLGLWFWSSRRTKSQSTSFSAAAAQKLTDTPGLELFPNLSPDGQSVVFARSQHGNWDIYRQAAGARTAVNLTQSEGSLELQPAYSPDGKLIAFRSSLNGGGVFVMNNDGSGVKQLTDAGFNPAWSPDGSEVVVADDICWTSEARNTYPSASRLWAINVNSRVRRVITAGDAVQPNWSPHGQRIAFWGAQKGGHRDIWTVAATGGERTPVTDDAFIDWNPVWSPDGEHLYFLSNRGGEMNLWRVAIDEQSGQLRSSPEPATLPSNNCQYVSFARNGSALVYGQNSGSENLFEIDFDPNRGQVGGPPTSLTHGLKRYAMFSMSPDEKSFAYLARGEPQQDLFTADLAGTPLRRLTDDVAQDIVPRWSPDGQWIAFLSDRSGKYEIWKVRPDGTGLAQMTNEPGREVIAPMWWPDSRRLLYQVRNVNSYSIDVDRPGTEQQPQALPGQPPPGFIPWDLSPDGAYLAGWQPTMAMEGRWGVVVYSFADHRYERLTELGGFPLWLNDNRRLLFHESGDLYLLDTRGGKPVKIYSVKEPGQIGTHTLSRDNRRIYFTEISGEADIWFMKLN